MTFLDELERQSEGQQAESVMKGWKMCEKRFRHHIAYAELCANIESGLVSDEADIFKKNLMKQILKDREDDKRRSEEDC